MARKKPFYRIYLPNQTLLTGMKFKNRRYAEYFIRETGYMGKYKISREKRKINKVI